MAPSPAPISFAECDDVISTWPAGSGDDGGGRHPAGGLSDPDLVPHPPRDCPLRGLCAGVPAVLSGVHRILRPLTGSFRGTSCGAFAW